ncbi:MAG: ATP-binding protein [Ignavibacteriaceae bacterium]|nr:ATP-binding protein [Ignavibacteriaceae bacterium]
MITRKIESVILESLVPGKVVILLGARRTGKTVLLKKIVSMISEPGIFFNGEDFEVQRLLENRSVANYEKILGTTKLLVIDEAQKVPEIGKILKLMIDSIPGLRIIVTGSSAFDLTGKPGEPLTGRNRTFRLFPLSEQELDPLYGITEKRAALEERLVFGSYPEVISIDDREAKVKYLKELVNDYLLRDLLSFEGVKNAGVINNLLRLVAFQAGSEVSMSELSSNLGIARNTVEKYLDLLSKVYVIFKVEGFSRNLRKEITKNAKWYFYDNGIRNTLVANLNPLGLRNDTGSLWENFIISERIKFQEYQNVLSNNFFWRTYDKQEIDWIEERGGKLFAYEFKFNKEKAKFPIAFSEAYPESEFRVISANNYHEFVL